MDRCACLSGYNATWMGKPTFTHPACLLARHQDRGEPAADRALLAYAFHDSVWAMETALWDALDNFPARWVGLSLRTLIFPWGRRARWPGDRLARRTAQAVLATGEARDRLLVALFVTPGPHHPAGRLVAALDLADTAEPLERKLLKAAKDSGWGGGGGEDTLDRAVANGVLTEDERAVLVSWRAAVWDAIGVDDFEAGELVR